MSEKRVTNNYEIVNTSRIVTGTDTNAYAFSNTGTTQVRVQGEILFPNQSLVFNSVDDESLDYSTYEIAFLFPNSPNNQLLIRRRKVTWIK
jgi:hypothetical protein